GGLADLLHGGQQEAGEHADDGNDDQQLDQGEASAARRGDHAGLSSPGASTVQALWARPPPAAREKWAPRGPPFPGGAAAGNVTWPGGPPGQPHPSAAVGCLVQDVTGRRHPWASTRAYSTPGSRSRATPRPWRPPATTTASAPSPPGLPGAGQRP